MLYRVIDLGDDEASEPLARGGRQQPQAHRLGGEALGRQRGRRGQAHRREEQLADGLDDEDHRQEPPRGQVAVADPGLEPVAEDERGGADDEHRDRELHNGGGEPPGPPGEEPAHQRGQDDDRGRVDGLVRLRADDPAEQGEAAVGVGLGEGRHLAGGLL